MNPDWEQYRAEQPQATSQSMDWEQFRAPKSNAEERPNNLNPNFSQRIPGALGKVAKDVGGGIANLPLKAIVGLLKTPAAAIKIAKALPDVGRQIVNEPGRAASNVIAGLADIGHGALNLPSAVADYANRIGLIEPETAKKVPHQKDISSELNELVQAGGGPKPGDALLRSIVGHVPAIIPAAKLALSPLKLTTRSIKNNILNTEKTMKEKYSGPKGLYTQHFDQARNRGLGAVNINPSMVNIKAISKNTPSKFTESTQNFLNNPTLENAQKSVSDLGFLERTLQKRFISNGLTSEESKALNEAMKAKEHIKKQMFTDSSGKFHPDLHAVHESIQKGYASEVIPYTKNKDIQAFKKGELTKEDLIKRLSKGKFYAQRGKEHKALGIRKTIANIHKSPFVKGAEFLGGGSLILNELLGKHE